MTDEHEKHGVTRRGFNAAAAGGTLVAGVSAALVTRAVPTGAAEASAVALPGLDGTLSIDESTRSDYAQDFGQIVHEYPVTVLRPSSVAHTKEEPAGVLRAAALVRFASTYLVPMISEFMQRPPPTNLTSAKARLFIDLLAAHLKRAHL